MIQAYNHLLTEYSSSLPVNSSAHKPKELKEVYSKIVNMNRHSAYFKLDLSSDKQLFTLSLKDSALSLTESLKSISESLKQPTVTKGVLSTDPQSVGVSLLDQEGAPAFEDPVRIRVNQLAMPQINKGRYLASDEPGPSPASYRFQIQVDEDSYEFSYNISNASTNRELMSKLTDFINKSNISVRASIEDEPNAGLSRMVLSSVDTGIPEEQELTFTIADSTKTSGLVSWFGLDNVAQNPSNAQFDINGDSFKNMSNEFILNKTLSVKLNNVSSEEISLFPETISEMATEETGHFVDIYNNIMELAKTGLTGNRRSGKLQTELNHILSSNLAELKEVGITRGEDNKLVFDPSALRNPNALQHLKTLFEEPDGLLAQLTHKMQDISLNPMDYVDKIIITYPNTSRTGFSNPYATSVYSGMMFNSYC